MRFKPQKWRFSRDSAAPLNRIRKDRRLKEATPTPASSSPEFPEFVKAKEAAAWLGIPLRSFHQYVRQRLLPSYKLGRHRLFRKNEILQAIGANYAQSRAEILR